LGEEQGLTFIVRREVFCDGGTDGGGSADEDYGDWHFYFGGNQLIDYWEVD
jgi:hypothetical protein